MKVLVINPIGTTKYDKDDLDYFRSKASPGTEIELVSLKKGPEEITSYESQIEICPEILDILRTKEYDAAVINCFANPCIDAAKEISDKPVVGPGEASMAMSLLLGDQIAIISPVDKASPQFLINARKMGVGDRINVIKSTGIKVDNLSDDLEVTREAIMNVAMECVNEHHSDVVILGCTGMAYVADRVKKDLPVPMIEPAEAALKAAELIVSMGLTQSKHLIYRH